MSSLFDPVCICNFQQHAEMNRKIQNHTSDARLLPRTLSPRPMMDNRCTTHRAYQPTEVIDNRNNNTTSASSNQPSERALTLHPQLAQLKTIDSQLLGLGRSSAHHRMPNHPPRIPDTSDVWKAFASPIASHCPLQLTSDETRCANAPCYHTTISAQTRGPWMSGARNCAPTDTAANTHLWGEKHEKKYPLERALWNNHPFALEHHAVARHHIDPLSVVTLQNAFTNSTRRKLIVR